MSTLTVRDVMTPYVVTVAPDLGFKQIVDVLVESGVSAVPVVDEQHHVVGVVSEADLLYKVEFDGADVHARLLERRSRRQAKEKAAGDTAAALMTSPPITVADTATVVDAARLMEHHDVKRLPVVDAEGRMVGIVSRRDVLRRYLRPDDEIRRDVVDGVLLHTMWIDPLPEVVEVTDGRVTIRGRVDRRSTAQIADRLIRTVDGVVTVDVSALGWERDDTAGRRP